MAVYREGFSIVEKLIALQGPVYQDGADYGVTANPDSPIFKAVKQLVDWYGVKGSRIDHGNFCGISHDVELVDEWAVSDNRKTMKEATQVYRVTWLQHAHYKSGYINRRNLFDRTATGFFTIEMKIGRHLVMLPSDTVLN
jgi:hypothetical protein